MPIPGTKNWPRRPWGLTLLSTWVAGAATTGHCLALVAARQFPHQRPTLRRRAGKSALNRRQPGLKSLISSAQPSRNTFNVNPAVRFERRKDADTKAYGRTRWRRPITLQDCIGSDRHEVPGRRRRRSPACRHVKVMIAAVGVRIVGAGAPIASPRDHRAIPMNLVHLLILPSFLSNREEPARLQ